MTTNKNLIIWPLVAVLGMAVIAIFLLTGSSLAPTEKSEEATPTGTEEGEKMVETLTGGDTVEEIEKDLDNLKIETVNYESEIQKLEKDLEVF